MNTRAIIIILALSAPVATLLFMTNQAEVLPKPRENPQDNAAKAKMSHDPQNQPQAANSGPRRVRPPATLDEAKDRLRRKLADLEKMTAEEWEEEQRCKMDNAMHINRQQPTASRRPWDSMTPEQKIDLMAKHQKELDAGKAKERAPEIVREEAKPQSNFPAPAK